jgi:hypothetical protein
MNGQQGASAEFWRGFWTGAGVLAAIVVVGLATRLVRLLWPG